MEEMTLLFIFLRAVLRNIQKLMQCNKTMRHLNISKTIYSSYFQRKTCPLIDGF